MEKEGDTLRTNYMAREKAANLLGTTSEQLAKILEQEKIAKSLGATELMKLEGVKLDNKVAELRKKYQEMGKDGEEDLKKIDKFLEAKDTRTSHEKVMEDNIVQIAKSIIKIGGVGTREKGGQYKPPEKVMGVS